MPFELLDLILAGIMLISGLLALMRGFTREVLTLVAWALAALAAYFAWDWVFVKGNMQDQVMSYISNDKAAMIAVAAAAFIVTLIIVSVISVKISDSVVSSAIGAVDRTLGFFFGLARGLLLVTAAYAFYGWLNSERQEGWIANAQSLPLIKNTGRLAISVLPIPPDIVETLNATAFREGAPQPAPGTEEPATGQQQGYSNGDSKSLDNLVEGTGGTTQSNGQ